MWRLWELQKHFYESQHSMRLRLESSSKSQMKHLSRAADVVPLSGGVLTVGVTEDSFRLTTSRNGSPGNLPPNPIALDIEKKEITV